MKTIDSVLHKFISTDRLHRTLLEKQVSKGSLHRSQHRVLLYIFKCEEMPTQKEIAQHFEISSAAVAVMLKKLEASGYIQRVSQKDDLRFNRIAVTEKGKSVINATKKLVDEVDFQMFENFSSDELEIFYSCLEKMQENLLKIERKEKDNEKMV